MPKFNNIPDVKIPAVTELSDTDRIALAGAQQEATDLANEIANDLKVAGGDEEDGATAKPDESKEVMKGNTSKSTIPPLSVSHASPPIPVVSSKSLDEINIEDISEADIMYMPAIVAKSLGQQNNLEPKILRKEYAYRWVNRLSDNGGRYTNCLHQGFVNATVKDVQILNDSMVKDGHIIVGDLILMKMPKLQYFQHIKKNAVQAEASVSPKALKAVGTQEGNKAIGSVGAPRSYDISSKVSFYHPPIGELPK